jgi:hypothetical protein
MPPLNSTRVLGTLALVLLLAKSAFTMGAEIQVRISERCKWNYYGPESSGRPRLDWVAWDTTRAKVFEFVDPRTMVVLRIANDGRRITAISKSGKQLWVRNPFQDAQLCPYRTPNPVVATIEVPVGVPLFGPGGEDALRQRGMDMSHSFVRVQFDSSQFGFLDEANGNYYDAGQN